MPWGWLRPRLVGIWIAHCGTPLFASIRSPAKPYSTTCGGPISNFCSCISDESCWRRQMMSSPRQRGLGFLDASVLASGVEPDGVVHPQYLSAAGAGNGGDGVGRVVGVATVVHSELVPLSVLGDDTRPGQAGHLGAGPAGFGPP